MVGSTGSGHHWFEELADHMGAAYLRYSFTRGTEQEVGFLIDQLGLEPGMRILDVGCGPGRHAHALASRGLHVHGVDISERFVTIAAEGAPPPGPGVGRATFERADARGLAFDSEFDVAISLCQGAFGLAGEAGGPVPRVDPDGEILARMAAAVVPGGRVAVSAFSAYFQVRHLEEGERFDADHGVAHERVVVRSEAGEELAREARTSCFTPRELRLLAASAGLRVDQLWSVTPGRYGTRPPSIDEPEYLLVATRLDAP